MRFLLRNIACDLLLYFSAYQVIILNVVGGAENLPDDYDSNMKDSNDAAKENLKFYVAAEIENVPGYEESWEFTVGDDKTYGAYRNKELERGEDYIVYQRALTNDNGVSNFKVISVLLNSMNSRLNF